MKQKSTIVFFLILSAGCFFVPRGYADYDTREIQLNGVTNPTGISISGDRLFVTQNEDILVFNRFTGEISGSIGKKGEGPQEYNFPPRLRHLQGKLVVLAADKLLMFNEFGHYISEMKMPGHGGFFLPLTEGFIGRKNIQEEKTGRYFQEISLYTSSMTPEKQLYKAVMPGMLRLQPGINGKSDYPVISDFIHYETDNQYIVLGDSSKGFFFLIFNHQGEKAGELNLPYSKKNITDEQKNEFVAHETAQPWMRRLKDRLNFTFPDVFPAFRYFTLLDQAIYVMTYEENSSLCRWEKIILPQESSRTLWLPKVSISDSGVPLITFYQNDAYFLSEDIESEQWVLKKTKVSV